MHYATGLYLDIPVIENTGPGTRRFSISGEGEEFFARSEDEAKEIWSRWILAYQQSLGFSLKNLEQATNNLKNSIIDSFCLR